MLWTTDTDINVDSDIRVYGFMLIMVTAITILLGLLPALRMTRISSVLHVKHKTMGGAHRLNLNKLLISFQVGLSLLLVVGAGLLTRTLINIQRIETGWDPENILIFHAGLGPRQADFCKAVGALPGVQAVSYANLPLLTGARSNTQVPLTDNPSENLSVLRLDVSEMYLQTMGIPLLAGRGFETLDVEDAQQVIIVNRSLAQALFQNDNPVGRFLTIQQQPYRIVGVCGDSKYYDLKMPFEPTVFFPARKGAWYAIRTAASPQDFIQRVRQTLRTVNASVPMSEVTTLKASLSEHTRQEQCFAWLVSSLALLAVLQSCIGLYGLMALQVNRRTGEIGLRMALGASPRTVAWPILRSALSMAAIGVVIGLPMVWGIVRIIRNHLYGIQPHDPVTIIAAVVLLVGIAILAAWIPARRAARIDPMEALRYE
jgi:predicted permease